MVGVPATAIVHEPKDMYVEDNLIERSKKKKPNVMSASERKDHTSLSPHGQAARQAGRQAGRQAAQRLPGWIYLPCQQTIHHTNASFRIDRLRLCSKTLTAYSLFPTRHLKRV